MSLFFFTYSIRFRCLGLRGHHAFIRKTVNTELQNETWKYTDQIIPSVLFNLQQEQSYQFQPFPYIHYNFNEENNRIDVLICTYFIKLEQLHLTLSL